MDANENALQEPSSRWRSADLRVDGCRVRYWEAGSGEPVLLLHGFPQDHNCWRHQVTALQARHRVIVPDWFGFGESERRVDVAPTFEREVERVALLGAALCGPSYNLICHDYGGYLGLAHTLRRPETVRRLALLNTRALRNFRPGFQRFCHLQRGLSRSPMRLVARTLPLAALYRKALASYVRHGCFSGRELDSYVGWMDTPEGRAWYFHFFAHYQVSAPVALAATLERVRCPTAIVWGTRDAYIPFSTAAELAARIPSATLTVLQGAGHYVMEERPKEVTQALLALLSTPALAT